ncbi:flagellar biosynthesis protein FlhA [Arboricoccus pini]|uniref:Flagellar biosynthesis protein FlhA n=1 Tax=Arboricoccus pini TaxID=1963835 RepID=A0A212Q1I0_9PROT|nr:flagellar biosynthesis protein FlhA [Arboricoccus pini]SNB53140.1 flagellar biosynthesis protein FlhA [Arboricoccus pini]
MNSALSLQSLGNGARKLVRETDVLLAIGIISIILMLVVPLPPLLLDAMLALSITLAILILLTSLLIERPLDFSAFPTVLLIATMLRLALNIGSTRLILGNGHEGPSAAGHVIQAFGGFMMQGNAVIGVIVFAILVIVNFVVITKGSGRIAEVAARFSLDAMPGKQMAIDADLGAGLIDEKVARRRRTELEGESAFFGAMDGAAKFVRGDAVAGLIITAINLVAGIVIGVGQMGISVAQAVHTYTLLTIGDGLVSQIPALVISTAAGLLVSKAGVNGRADRALFGQLGHYYKALGMTSAASCLLAVFPGLPTIPFLAIGVGAGYLAYRGYEAEKVTPAEEATLEQAVPPSEQPIAEILEIDPLRLELGYGLLGLLGDGKGPRLPDQIKSLRRQLAADLGFVLPSVRIQDNIHLPPDVYVLKLKELDVGRGEVRPTQLMVMSPRGEPVELPGEEGREPTFGLPANWVSPSLRDEAVFRGYTVVDPATVVTTHLTEIIKDNLAELLSLAETQKLLKGLDEPYQKLLQEISPARISTAGIQRILQKLLAERISIRDLQAIVEAISEALARTQSSVFITEHVRTRLSRQLCSAAAGTDGFIAVLTLSATWEQAFDNALGPGGEDRQLAMLPSEVQNFIQLLNARFEELAMRGELPVVLTSPGIRPYVRAIVERYRPATTVLSQNEIHLRARIKFLGQI